jgi:hypothetical protein
MNRQETGLALVVIVLVLVAGVLLRAAVGQ